MSKNKTQKGFTLIELLVVVAIISLLSSVVLGALNDARAKARDRALVQQVKQIQNALELYKGKYGSYPGVTQYARLDSLGNWIGTLGSSLETQLSEFLPKISPPYSGYLYYYRHNSAKCADHAGTAPYVIYFKPETAAFDGNYPGGIFGASIYPVGYKCASIY